MSIDLGTVPNRGNVRKWGVRGLLPVFVILVLGMHACSKKADIKSSVADLEKAFPTTPTATSADNAQTTVPANTAPDANAYVNAAVTAAREKDYASSVIALQEAQRSKGVTADKLMTIEQAKQAMIGDLLQRAERGDAKAKADLQAIERTHSQ